MFLLPQRYVHVTLSDLGSQFARPMKKVDIADFCNIINKMYHLVHNIVIESAGSLVR